MDDFIDRDFSELIFRVGQLYSRLASNAARGVYQGEFTVSYKGAAGEKTLYVYVDGTDFQLSDAPGHVGLSLSVGFNSEEE